jgi:hypothetical protein
LLLASALNVPFILLRNVVADKKSGRVLGSQIVGGEGVKALALLLKADIKDLASYDACYAPPSSRVWEPVNIAASQNCCITDR